MVLLIDAPLTYTDGSSLHSLVIGDKQTDYSNGKQALVQQQMLIRCVICDEALSN
jgi:hypothetical protein